MSRIAWIFIAWGLVVLSAAPTAAGEIEAQHRLVIVTPSETDARVEFLHQAVSFWNRALTEIGLDLRVVEAEVKVAPPETSALENFTRLIWQQAGRLRPGMPSPAVPDEVAELGGDVVVFLSVQPTMSFAWPLEGASRYFVAVPKEPGSRLNRAGSTRNVIAHELGHTLGLIHHRNPIVLMCSPCRPTLGPHDPEGFLPLTEVDRQRLQANYPATRSAQ